jgi:hypothetical protein
MIYKPDKSNSAVQGYNHSKTNGKAKSPLGLELTEIAEKFKPSYVEESHDAAEDPITQI